MLGWLVTNAWAQGSGGGQAPLNPIVSFAPFILIFVIFYFLLIRPQQQKAKQRQVMNANLKKGDRVTTSGGLMGTVTTLGEKVITIQIAEGVRVKVVRNNIEMQKDDGKN